MGNDHISMRQLLALEFAALLAPTLQYLPGQSANLAGEAGWLSALAALPALLLLAWGLGRLPAGTGLAGGLELAFGKVLGRAATAVYLLWGLVCLASQLRSYGQRFLSTSYRNVSLASFVVILLGLGLWLAWGKLSAFARTGEVFFLILCATVGAVLVFALFNMEPQNFLPIWTEDLAGVAKTAVPGLGV